MNNFAYLIAVEKQLGFNYEIRGSDAEHYQQICPKCRRAMFGLAQGAMWAVNGTTETPSS